MRKFSIPASFNIRIHAFLGSARCPDAPLPSNTQGLSDFHLRSVRISTACFGRCTVNASEFLVSSMRHVSVVKLISLQRMASVLDLRAPVRSEIIKKSRAASLGSLERALKKRGSSSGCKNRSRLFSLNFLIPTAGLTPYRHRICFDRS